MTIATTLALQSLPWAGFAFAGREDRDLFAVTYIAALGLVLTLTALVGEPATPSGALAAITEALSFD